jgi:hypothetical protein
MKRISVSFLYSQLLALQKEAIAEKGSVGDILRKIVDAWMRENK